MTQEHGDIFLKKQPVQSRSTATVDAIVEAAARILESDGLPDATIDRGRPDPSWINGRAKTVAGGHTVLEKPH